MPSTDTAELGGTSAAERPARVATRADDRRRNDTRARIIDAALRLFSEKGFVRTTIAEIEGAVGLRPGSGGLYRHFTSKDELLLEGLRAYRDRVAALRHDLASQASVRPIADLGDDLQHLVGALGLFLAGELSVVQLSLDSRGLPDSVRHTVGESWDEGYGIAADLFERHGVPADTAKALALSAIGSLDHYFSSVGSGRLEPGGMDPAGYLAAWVAQWTTIGAASVA